MRLTREPIVGNHALDTLGGGWDVPVRKKNDPNYYSREEKNDYI